MRIIFDQGTPVPLRDALPHHAEELGSSLRGNQKQPHSYKTTVRYLLWDRGVAPTSPFMSATPENPSPVTFILSRRHSRRHAHAYKSMFAPRAWFAITPPCPLSGWCRDDIKSDVGATRVRIAVQRSPSADGSEWHLRLGFMQRIYDSGR